MKYTELRYVLQDNEQILAAIRTHALGGPSPKIVGMTQEATDALRGKAGRAMAQEFMLNLKQNYVVLDEHRRFEEENSTKRPLEVLEDHVRTTSTMIAAYVGRAQWMAEQL